MVYCGNCASCHRDKNELTLFMLSLLPLMYNQEIDRPHARPNFTFSRALHTFFQTDFIALKSHQFDAMFSYIKGIHFEEVFLFKNDEKRVLSLNLKFN